MKTLNALLLSMLLLPAVLTAPAEAVGEDHQCPVGSITPCEISRCPDLFQCLPPVAACADVAVPGPEDPLPLSDEGSASEDLPTAEGVDVPDASPTVGSSCCRQRHVSQAGATTHWTYPYGPGATGFNQPSLGVPQPWTPPPWATINGAQFIWKDNGWGSTGPPFGLPVVFSREFITCSTIPTPVNMKVNADNHVQVYFNNQPVFTCMGTCHQSVFNVPTQMALPYPNVNTWSWRVHNVGGPAMLQYAYTF